MTQSKSLRISIVIPVYNEADRLNACLQAIAHQSVKPYEVIVVDNNSTDESADIARKYDFVCLLHESRQGVVYARNLGFNAAHGEIIGRIDADSLIPADWIEKLELVFKDKTVAAVSGAPHYYDQAFSILGDTIDHFVRARLARKLGDNNFLYGANMALRRTAWQQVRVYLCAKKGVHEDLDLAIHLQSFGWQVAYDQTLIAGVSSRRIDSGVRSYVPYTLIGWHTYAAHHLNTKRHMTLPIATAWMCHVPGRVLYRAYDQYAYFSWTKLFTATSNPRVDPTANVV